MGGSHAVSSSCLVLVYATDSDKTETTGTWLEGFIRVYTWGLALVLLGVLGHILNMFYLAPAELLVPGYQIGPFSTPAL